MPELPRVLFVCHANVCRSPMAERLARRPQWCTPAAGEALAPRLFSHSAGTHAYPGRPMHPAARRALLDAGADPTGFRSRSLTREQIASSDLVLAASRAERSACAALVPAALGRMFTLRQFGRLSRCVETTGTAGAADPSCPVDAGGDRLAALLDAMRRVRGTLQPVALADDDLADPVDGTPEDMVACVRQIQWALAPLLMLFAPA